ncbi:MAG: M48 family metallopeptidase [Burkholderiales bacterium]|jgi:Zn-dependent protease with chaperone function|nr:M48 family metallopeptidase [Burkholderiales bacterium]
MMHPPRLSLPSPFNKGVLILQHRLLKQTARLNNENQRFKIMHASGFYFDGKSSKKQSARLVFTGTAHWFVVSDEGDSLTTPESIAEARVSSRLGNTPTLIRFSQGGIFESVDHEALDAMLLPHRPRVNWAHRLESRLRYVVAGLLVTAAVVFCLIYYGIPAGAKAVAFALPEETTRVIGRGTLQLLDKEFLSQSKIDEQEQQRLRQRLLAFIPAINNIPVSVEFRNAPMIGANAFALPSGTIVFTDQLIFLAENDEDLLAIYGHEVGHVSHRHAMRQLLQASTLAIAVALFTGDLTSTSSLIAAAPVLLIQSGYSREFEREADLFALHTLQSNHISPKHFSTMLRKISASHQEENDKPAPDAKNAPEDHEGSDKVRWQTYLSTHPDTEERIKMFDEAR